MTRSTEPAGRRVFGRPVLSRRLFVSGAAAIPLIAAAACRSEPADGEPSPGTEPEQITIRMSWWGNDERARITGLALDLFEDRNPSIIVQRDFLGDFGGYWDRMATETAAGGMPDVIQMSTSFIVEYGERGVLLDLEPYFSDAIGVDQLAGGALEAFQTQSGTFGVPWVGNVWTLIYNSGLLQEAGVSPPSADLSAWTWEAFEDLATEIAANTPDGVYGTADFGGQSKTFETWLRQRGKDLFLDGALGFEHADLEEFWGIADRMVRSGVAAPPDITVESNVLEQNPLALSQVGMMFQWSNLIVGLTQVGGGPEAISLELSRAPGESPNPSQCVHASQLLSASGSSANPDAAALLVGFLLNDPDAGQILGTNRGTPLNESVAEAIRDSVEPVETKEIDFISDHSEAFATAVPPYPLGGSQITDGGIFQRVYEEVMFGRSTPAEAAASAIQQSEQALS